MPKVSGGSDDLPAPGASQATTVYSSDSASIWCRHTDGPSPTYPWSSTTGAPVPARSYAIARPSTSIRSTADPTSCDGGVRSLLRGRRLARPVGASGLSGRRHLAAEVVEQPAAFLHAGAGRAAERPRVKALQRIAQHRRSDSLAGDRHRPRRPDLERGRGQQLGDVGGGEEGGGRQLAEAEVDQPHRTV